MRKDNGNGNGYGENDMAHCSHLHVHLSAGINLCLCEEAITSAKDGGDDLLEKQDVSAYLYN